MNASTKHTRKSFIEDIRKDGQKNSIFNFLKRPFKSPKLLVIGLVFYVGVLVMISLPKSSPVQEGVPARQDVISRVDFSYHDEEKTKKAREFEKKKVPPIFNVDDKRFGVALSDQLHKDFKNLISEIITHKTLATLEPTVKNTWFMAAKQTLNEEEFQILKNDLRRVHGAEQNDIRLKMYDAFHEFAKRLAALYWIDHNNNLELKTSYKENQEIRLAGVETLVPTNNLLVFAVAAGKNNDVAINKVKELLEEPFKLYFSEKSKPIITKLFVSRLAPNIELDLKLTEAARDRVAQGAQSEFEFAKDKVIIHRGAIAQDIHLVMIEEEKKAFEILAQQGKVLHSRFYEMAGRYTVFTFFYLIFLVILTEKSSSITRNQGRFFSFSMLSALVLFSGYWLGSEGLPYLCVPFLFVAEVFQIAYKRRDCLLAIIFLGLSLTLVANVPGVAVTLTLGALAGIYCSKNIKSRLTLLLSGLVGGLVMALINTASLLPWMPTDLAESGVTFTTYFSGSGVALLNGIVTGILVTVILPFIEKIFSITTPLTWLELGNMNHPALKRIAMHSPGTWQHSLMLSALSEAASEAIGADGLMARVVCYYHDLGKSLKPQYYIENQQGMGENPHDKLTPAMSALIIQSHPKDGAELARQLKLPDQVIDAILQHHGTTRVEYFYRMAMKLADNPDDIREDNYTYPGPKPQYKEMGIIMLADSAESATRSLKNPTPGKIRSTIENIVKSKMEMGQLDESGLTLTEITTVVETFTRVINNIHHHRIEYPDDPRKSGEHKQPNHEMPSVSPAT